MEQVKQHLDERLDKIIHRRVAEVEKQFLDVVSLRELRVTSLARRVAELEQDLLHAE